MYRINYKKMVDQIKPDADLQKRLTKGLHRQPSKRKPITPFLYAGASLLMIFIVVVIGMKLWGNTGHPEDKSSVVIKQPGGETVTIPKIKLPNQSDSLANMVGLVVYKGNIYTQTSSSIAPEAAKSLVGEKLGRTKGTIDEWIKQTDYTELASSIGIMDIYSVKGYDSDFRIMSFQEYEGQIYAEFYECLNGITIAAGKDLIGKLNLKDNIEYLQWQDYNSWYYSKKIFNDYPVDGTVQAFFTALDEAKPIAADQLFEEGINDSAAQNQKVLFLKLKDKTEVRLSLYKGNYVRYASAHVFFQVDAEVFSMLWGRM